MPVSFGQPSKFSWRDLSVQILLIIFDPAYMKYNNHAKIIAASTFQRSAPWQTEARVR
jgi:hypothetical protein